DRGRDRRSSPRSAAAVVPRRKLPAGPAKAASSASYAAAVSRQRAPGWQCPTGWMIRASRVARGNIARMLRAVLVGLLSVSVVACKSSDESAKVQPGVAAGKVIEVHGT